MNLNPWKYEYIHQLAKEAGILARQDGLRPALASDMIRSYKTSHRFNIPFLGDYVPEGWKQDDTIFVDLTGIARPGEFTGITQQEFYQRIQEYRGRNDIGYGVTEQGQTQVLVAAYRRNT